MAMTILLIGIILTLVVAASIIIVKGNIDLKPKDYKIQVNGNGEYSVFWFFKGHWYRLTQSCKFNDLQGCKDYIKTEREKDANIKRANTWTDVPDYTEDNLELFSKWIHSKDEDERERLFEELNQE